MKSNESLTSKLRSYLDMAAEMATDPREEEHLRQAYAELDQLERATLPPNDLPADIQAEWERMARDAERYRFLRQPGNAIVYAKDRNAWGDNVSGHVAYKTAEELDAAIDVARRAETKEPPLPDEREDPCHPDFIAPLAHEKSERRPCVHTDHEHCPICPPEGDAPC